LDEAETYLSKNEELRGIINSGHRRDGSVIRCVGDNHEPMEFSTWAPMLLAQIGDPAATVHDRSIVITMSRKKPTEHVERFRSPQRRELHLLARQAARWVREQERTIAKSEPPSLNFLHDRANDNWQSLLAIADAAGGMWPTRAREAARSLAEDAGHDAACNEEMLLTDIHWLFQGRPEQGQATTPVDRVSSGEIATQLAGVQGRPWAEWRGGKPISENAIARILKPLNIRPSTIRFDDGKVLKGYRRQSFEDAWSRYGVVQTVTPLQSNDISDLGDPPTVTAGHLVTDEKSRKPNKDVDCNGVTAGETRTEEETVWTV
jgi:hypothetical protein